MKPACDARMMRPNTMSNARTMAVIPMYVATRPRPGIVGAPMYGDGCTGVCTGDVELVMCDLLLCSGDRELRDHRVMTQSTVLETANAVRSRRRERVADDVGVSGHRLRLRDETVIRVVHAESVVHVRPGDADLDELTSAHRGRCQLPRPLVAGRLHHLARGSGVVPVRSPGQRVGD